MWVMYWESQSPFNHVLSKESRCGRNRRFASKFPCFQLIHTTDIVIHLGKMAATLCLSRDFMKIGHGLIQELRDC
jgi:hypothetical protein